MDDGIGNWVTVHGQRNPDKVALIDGDTGARYTYGELEQRTNSLADALRTRGVRQGDRVAFVMLNSPHLLEVVFAAAKLGAIAVSVNYRLSAPEMHYILDDSAACIAFASTQAIDTVRQALAGTGVRELIEIPAAGQRIVSTDSAFENLISEGSAERVQADVHVDEVSMLMYTSGTTGFPKGTMLTHGNHLWNAISNVCVSEGLIPKDVSLTAAPMFHIGAFGIFTLPLVYLGGTSVILESFAPGRWLDVAERFRPTVAFCVPAMWAAIHAAGLDGRDLSSFRYAISGGAPCPVVLIEALREHGMVFIEGFGLTETAPIASALGSEDVVSHAGSVGKPVPHLDYRIADDAGRDVARGEVGELLIRGPNVFVGYWEKPEATGEALQNDWFHSGDLARQDEDGFYFIVDRKKDMVISGGENVYPAEVEQALYRHPAIAEVAVIGTPDDTWGEAVTAVVALKPEAQLSEDELIDWIREGRLARFKCPRVVAFVDTLPRTATGKVLKRELRSRWGRSGATVWR